MLIHAFVPHSRVNGPGVRAVVYFQGCNLGCAGCWNPATHSFTGPSYSAEEIAEQIARAPDPPYRRRYLLGWRANAAGIGSTGVDAVA